MHAKLVVGILGGMGPAATVDLMRRVVALTPAHDDIDHIHMLVDNNPRVPSRIRALIEKTGPSPGPFIANMARGLAAQGADFLAMPCNTAHHYHREIAAAVEIPVLNVVTLTADVLSGPGAVGSRIGLLASSALARIQLFESAFADTGLELHYPPSDAQSALMDLIRDVKAGREALDTGAMNRAADALAQTGVDSLLIACTELSVIAEHLNASMPVADTAQILATAIVERAMNGKTMSHSRALS